jgi:hypothetical protein
MRFSEQDKEAEADYQAWLMKNWSSEAANKGISEPAALKAFIKRCKNAEENRVSKLGPGPNWQLAYKTYIRDKQQNKPQVPFLGFQYLALS